ncbi:MAG: hypothetical protein KTR27_22215 [Leptolyngbyaceae cyanobacterium MAG.088]|nr:hypothetical protein [Leptolyngbyaceae cyanobacterium MAG.088]
MTQSKLYAPTRGPVHQRPNRQHLAYHVKPRPSSRPWLLGGLALVALALVPQDVWSRLSTPLSTKPIQSQAVQPWQRANTNATCQAMINANQRLSRSQLTQLLSIEQNSPQANVHEAIASPYCTLSKAHQSTQSEAYPLAFDPDTWIVMNYEQGLYKSYDFVFQK